MHAHAILLMQLRKVNERINWDDTCCEYVYNSTAVLFWPSVAF